MSDAIVIDHLQKSYKTKEVIADLSLTIPKGEFFGLLGPNGAGKTTTIHCVVGVNTITGGHISVMGHDVVTDYRAARTMIGISPQEFNIDPFTTTERILSYVGGYYGMDREQQKTRVEELLKQFDLVEHRKKIFRTLSGGLKRRVTIARALMHNPEVIILDEPTAGVDVESRRDIWRYLRELNEQGKTILLTSHYLEEVQALTTRIGIINKGALVFLGETAQFADGKALEEKYLSLTTA